MIKFTFSYKLKAFEMINMFLIFHYQSKRSIKILYTLNSQKNKYINKVVGSPTLIESHII